MVISPVLVFDMHVSRAAMNRVICASALDIKHESLSAASFVRVALDSSVKSLLWHISNKRKSITM